MMHWGGYWVKVKTIGLDYDIPYSKFRRSKFEELLRNVPNIDQVFIRRSPGGNTHVKLYPVLGVPLFRSMQVRAYMGDDAYRVYGDLKRLYLYGDNAMYDVLFDEHHKGQWRKAGKWREITP